MYFIWNHFEVIADIGQFFTFIRGMPLFNALILGEYLKSYVQNSEILCMETRNIAVSYGGRCISMR